MEKNEEKLNNFFDYQGKSKTNYSLTMIFKIVGLLLFGLGILFYFLFRPIKVEAEINDVWIIERQKTPYLQYNFYYDFNGTPYYGYGDDKMTYDVNNGEPTLSMQKGDIYYVYVTVVSPGSYSFSESYTYLFLVIILGISGLGLIVFGFLWRYSFMKKIKIVGDLNHDGKIDEEDLLLHSKSLKETEALKRKKQESLKYCKYCGSKLLDDALICPQCAAPRKQDN